MRKQVLVAWATSVPPSSRSAASASASGPPGSITRATARTRPSAGMGRSRRRVSSLVVRPVRAGNPVMTAQAIAASTGMTSGPAAIRPSAPRSQPLSGNSKVASPGAMSTSLVPNSRVSGGGGVRPSSSERS